MKCNCIKIIKKTLPYFNDLLVNILSATVLEESIQYDEETWVTAKSK